MGGGSIITPEKSYHLEFVTRHSHASETTDILLSRFQIKAKSFMRNGYYVTYLQSGEAVSDILALMGAHKTMMKFMNIKIIKEMRNTANRMVNCETANLDKTVAAAQKQLRAINSIDLSILPPDLQELASLRLSSP